MLFPPWNALFLELKCQQIAKRFIILPVRAKIDFSELDLRYMPYFRLNSRKFVNINHFLHLAQEKKSKSVFILAEKRAPPWKTSCWRPWFSLKRQKYEATQNVDQVTHSVIVIEVYRYWVCCTVDVTRTLSHTQSNMRVTSSTPLKRFTATLRQQRERPGVTHKSGEIPETQSDWLNRRHRLLEEERSSLWRQLAPGRVMCERSLQLRLEVAHNVTGASRVHGWWRHQ